MNKAKPSLGEISNLLEEYAGNEVILHIIYDHVGSSISSLDKANLKLIIRQDEIRSLILVASGLEIDA